MIRKVTTVDEMLSAVLVKNSISNFSNGLNEAISITPLTVLFTFKGINTTQVGVASPNPEVI